MSWRFKSGESYIWTPLPDIIVFCKGKSCRPLGMLRREFWILTYKNYGNTITISQRGETFV